MHVGVRLVCLMAFVNFKRNWGVSTHSAKKNLTIRPMISYLQNNIYRECAYRILLISR